MIRVKRIPDEIESQHFDQTAKLAYLRACLKRVSARPRRAALCRGLIQLIERDLLRYGLCDLTSGIRPAFTVIGEPDQAIDVVEEARAARDPVAYGVLHCLIHGQLAFWPGYRKGKPDIISAPLASWLGPIHSDRSGATRLQ